MTEKATEQMGRYFHCGIGSERDGVVTLEVSFGESATNERIVPAAVETLAALKLQGGRGIHIDGHISVPAAMAVAHAVAHLYGYVACRDPKIARVSPTARVFVVVISHDPEFRVGQLLECEDPDGSLTER